MPDLTLDPAPDPMPFDCHHALLEAGLSDGPRLERFSVGTHRLCPVEDTLARVSPRLAAMGITRVATITGLDRVGVPVVLVTRPASRSLAVAQGKGLTLAAARVSAIMESIECYHAERIDRPLRLGSVAELARRLPLVDIARLPRSAEREFGERDRILWIEARDVLDGAPRWVPFEAVHTDFRWPRLDGSGFFPANSNGLASGNHRLEAFAHALYELIERDALALAARRTTLAPVIEPSSVDDAACAELLAKLARAGLDVQIRDVTGDVGVACFECLVAGRDDDMADPELGSGCHPDRAVALARALTEAIQGRTTFITGSRDDYGDAPYAPAARRARSRHYRAQLTAARPTRAFTDIPHDAFERLDEELGAVLQKLVAVGIAEVLWVDLSLPDIGIPVVRALVPGLEGPFKGSDSDYVPGARARAIGAGR